MSPGVEYTLETLADGRWKKQLRCNTSVKRDDLCPVPGSAG